METNSPFAFAYLREKAGQASIVDRSTMDLIIIGVASSRRRLEVYNYLHRFSCGSMSS